MRKFNKKILAILALFIFLSLIYIDKPGVNSDQLLFVNASIGPKDESWIYKTIHGYPILLMAYIGALKAYIFKPIFYLFGVSIYSIRVPVILFTALGIFFLYKALQVKTNLKIALYTSILLAFDPSFISFSRVDFGPVVLEFFFKALSLLLLFKFFETKNSKYIFFLVASLGLGLFNKINFIWFINSLGFSTLIFYREKVFQNFKQFIKSGNFLLVFSYLIFLGYSLFILKKSSIEYGIQTTSLSPEVLKNNIFIVFNNYLSLSEGSSFMELVYGVKPHNFTNIFSAGLILLNIFGFFYLLKNKLKVEKELFKFYLFSLTMLAGLFIQLCLTTNAISPWHTYSLFPFLTIITAIVIYELQKRYKWAFLLLTGLILYNIATYIVQIHYYQKPVNNLNWSNQYKNLIEFTDSYPGLVLSASGELQTNILTFSKNYSKYSTVEMMVDRASYDSYALNLQGYFKKDPNILVIVPNSQTALFKDVQPYFFKFISDFHIKLTKLKEFKDGDKITYTVYKAN